MQPGYRCSRSGEYRTVALACSRHDAVGSGSCALYPEDERLQRLPTSHLDFLAMEIVLSVARLHHLTSSCPKIFGPGDMPFTASDAERETPLSEGLRHGADQRASHKAGISVADGQACNVSGTEARNFVMSGRYCCRADLRQNLRELATHQFATRGPEFAIGQGSPMLRVKSLATESLCSGEYRCTRGRL